MSMGEGSVNLIWLASTDNTVKEYMVFRDGKQVATTESTSYTDKGLKAAEYTYKILAVDIVGNFNLSRIYIGGDIVIYNDLGYRAKWWT